MEKIKHFSLFIIGLVLVMLTAACAQQEPIQIIITPTPNPNSVVVLPTETPTILPTNTPTTTATDTPTETPTLTATPTTGVQQSSGGPRVPTEYVRPSLEPTPTVLVDIPTVTNTPEAPTQSFTPQARVSPSPTETVMAGTPLPRFDANQMGLQLYSQVSFDDFTPVIASAEATGVGWVKIQANWAFLQPNGPNDWNAQMQLFERQIELAARPGFNVLLSIAKAPLWARSVGEEDGPPDDPQALADFITFMLGTKIGESIAAIEVWNEPNLIREWRGTLPFDGGGYMQLFAPAYNAIRAYSPAMTIVTAGFWPTGALADTVDDRVFLRQMYQNGLGDYQDVAIGVHPYGWGNPPDTRCCDQIPDRGWDDDPHFFFIETLDEYYAIMTEFGHGNLQMWVTEFGWATWDGLPGEPPEPWMTYTTLQTQIQHTVRAFEIGQSLPYVGPMFLWNLNFANQALIDNRDERAAYSMIIPILPVQERPLFWAIAEMTGALD